MKCSYRLRTAAGMLFIAADLASTSCRPCLAADSEKQPAAKMKITDLLEQETTKQGKFAGFFTSALSRDNGCHVAKVEGSPADGYWIRRDGKRGKHYVNIAHPVFSPCANVLAYAVGLQPRQRFVINEHEGPVFDAVLPDTFVFSNDGKRHAYLAKRGLRSVVVVDGQAQTEGDGGLEPWNQALVFSSSGNSVGYLEGSSMRKKMRAVVNGKRGPLYDGIDLRSLSFSADGLRNSYAANDRSKGNQWFRVIDGDRQRPFDTIGVDFVFSPDGKQTAYTGRRGNQWFLVVDGEPEVAIDGIVDHSLTFSPDSRRLAYAAAKQDRRCYVVLDGKPGPVYDAIGHSTPPGISRDQASTQTGSFSGSSGSVLFSPNSRRLAYLAHTGRTKHVVLDEESDGVEIEWLVGGMIFSSDSKRLAYGGRRGDKFFLVVDGKKGSDYDGLGHFGFSQDGKHIAFAAKKGARMIVVIDDREYGEYASVPAGPVFRGDRVMEFLAAEEPSLYRVEVSGF